MSLNTQNTEQELPDDGFWDSPSDLELEPNGILAQIRRDFEDRTPLQRFLQYHVIPTKYLCQCGGILKAEIGYRNYRLGFRLDSSGICVLLIWWYLSIPFPSLPKRGSK